MSPGGGGTVSINGSTQSYYPVSRTFYQRQNSSIALEAKPTDGYYFSHWSGDLTGIENPITLRLDSHKCVTANFLRVTHTLTIQVVGDGSTVPIIGEHIYDQGSAVEIIAIPDNHWRFYGWSGDLVGRHSASTTVIMDSDKIVTGSFVHAYHDCPTIGIISGAIGSVLVVLAITRRKITRNYNKRA